MKRMMLTPEDCLNLNRCRQYDMNDLAVIALNSDKFNTTLMYEFHWNQGLQRKRQALIDERLYFLLPYEGLNALRF